MALDFPGVDFFSQPTGLPFAAVQSAVPVFIGYTETGGANVMHRIQDFAQYKYVMGGPMNPEGDSRESRAILYQTVRHYFDNGGAPCFILSVGEYSQMAGLTADEVVQTLTSPEVANGIDLEQSITLIAIPDLVLLDDSETAQVAKVWDMTLAFCSAVPNRFAILDTPIEASAAARCLDILGNSGRAYGAAFWPHLITTYGVFDAYGAPEAPVVVPPSGAIAALVQANDQTLGVWVSPANRIISRTFSPFRSYLEGLMLYGRSAPSINVIRFSRGRGTLLWGSRTLVKPAEQSQWVYVQVRRLASYIEANFIEMASFCVFEPNNEITWHKVECVLVSWMRDLWGNGAFAGEQEGDAFRVAVGLGKTMTESDVLEGRMVVRVEFAPKNMAEFIELSLVFNTMESSSRA